MITVRIVAAGAVHDIEYATTEAGLTDPGLRALFADGVVSECEVICDGARVFKIPGTLVSWDRFCTELTARGDWITRRSCATVQVE